ncbi:hypothetical protein, partial [Streptomyces broussonetiae]|uniref:hypothetical protein n=1 Tax=Streptomyces broussonetiae TaxID=2686304 RepID=UPI0035E2885B
MGTARYLGERPSGRARNSSAGPYAAPRLPRRRKSMSRSDVLVDADWVQEHLDDTTIALVE